MQHKIYNLSNEIFKRTIGISKNTFKKMILILKKEKIIRKKKGGQKDKLSLINQLLIFFQYYREYRTMDAIAIDFRISKATISRTINRIENILIKSKLFRLPGKKKLSGNEGKIDCVIIDATETEINRPKKNKKNTTLEKRKNTQ